MLEHTKTLSDPDGHVHKLIFEDKTPSAEDADNFSMFRRR